MDRTAKSPTFQAFFRLMQVVLLEGAQDGLPGTWIVPTQGFNHVKVDTGKKVLVG